MWRPKTEAIKVKDKTSTTTGSLSKAKLKLATPGLRPFCSIYIHSKSRRIVRIDAHHAGSTSSGDRSTSSVRGRAAGNASPTSTIIVNQPFPTLPSPVFHNSQLNRHLLHFKTLLTAAHLA